MWECVQGASVVLLEDLPGLNVGVDLLDYVPDPVDAAADLLGDVGELFAGRLRWWGDHPPSDVALVGDPPADVKVLEAMNQDAAAAGSTGAALTEPKVDAGPPAAPGCVTSTDIHCRTP